ncbi:MAG: cytochrome c [Rubricoccaceae bacterium]|nr:cytochrome c [Rubricoccaceae bacterium]
MRTALKWAGIIVGGLLVLLLLIGGVMYVVGGANLNETFEVQTAALEIPTDSASIARGAHLARTNGCTDCHGPDLSGQVFADAPPFRVVASNLTAGAGGVGRAYTAEDLDRAIRHGVKPDGRPVMIMPSAAFHQMSDEDAAALIAYLQQVPPVDNELPPTEFRVPGRIMAAALLDASMEVRTEPARATRPAVGPTGEYGAYLASITCAYCHGEALEGAVPPIPGSPKAPPLAAAGQWSFDEFVTTLQTGTTPSGRALDPEFMPIAFTSQFDSTEYRALHAHLRQLRAPPSTTAAGG